MKNQWYKDAVIYQIYPRSFKDSNGDGIGDIPGIISKLDYIASLGVDAVWFSPMYPTPNCDFGYDISDYTNINPEFGTMADFEQLVEQLHAKGIKVLMDLVINHTSDQHKWFLESRKGKDNPYRDYYYWADGKGKNGKKPPNNWTSFFLGSAWQYDEQSGQYYLHLFDKNQPDLNYFNPKVIEEIKNIVRFWLEKGVDGFRCDVITLLSKTPGLPNGKPSIALQGSEHYIDGPRMEELLGELQTVLREYDAFTVGESVFIDVPKALRYTTEGNEYLTTVFAFDHISADNFFGVKQLVRKFSLRRLKKCIETWQHGLYGKSWNTLFWENHDQARIVGRYCDDGQFRVEGAKMMGTILMTLCGTPFVYQGQEFGTTS
ncbi:MAG: alpha-glucosidase, partial [Clostridia bacterium]|nr:alpha-glucosidase [Clostridia bacterium]